MRKIFNKKTWLDRIVEKAGGRIIEFIDGNREPVTIYRNEGNVLNEGDVLNAASFNDLEDRIESAFNDVDNITNELNVNPDWNSTEGHGEILNKPTLLSQFDNDAGFINDETFSSHAQDKTIHVNLQDRNKWNEVVNKVDRVDGKGLSTEDYTTEEKEKLASIGTNVQSDWNINDDTSDAYIKNKPTSLPASDVYPWAKEPAKPSYSASEVGADEQGAADAALSDAKSYTDTKISDLVNGAPETLDTLKEIADAIEENDTIVDTLNSAIVEKADKTDLNTHIRDTTVHVTSTEKSDWNAAKAHAESAHAPSNAEENQNAFSNITVGSAIVTANSKTDTLTFAEGNNVTITPEITNGKITISSVHPAITKSTDTTSATSPSSGSTFTAVDRITRDAYGHVTKVNTKTITLPSTSVAVDGELSSTSTNPVQNKVIAEALNNLTIGSSIMNSDNFYQTETIAENMLLNSSNNYFVSNRLNLNKKGIYIIKTELCFRAEADFEENIEMIHVVNRFSYNHNGTYSYKPWEEANNNYLYSNKLINNNDSEIHMNFISILHAIDDIDDIDYFRGLMYDITNISPASESTNKKISVDLKMSCFKIL